jgi:phosphoglycerate-specific signal transduction histidine kinase
MIGRVKRQLQELASDVAHYEGQLKRAQAELQRQHQRLLEQTRELERRSEALRQETTRRQAVEAALHGRDQQLTRTDANDLAARRRQVHARGRAAIAKLGQKAQ